MLPADLRQDASLAKRRHADLCRQKRVFDARSRIIGVREGEQRPGPGLSAAAQGPGRLEALAAQTAFSPAPRTDRAVPGVVGDTGTGFAPSEPGFLHWQGPFQPSSCRTHNALGQARPQESRPKEGLVSSGPCRAHGPGEEADIKVLTGKMQWGQPVREGNAAQRR